MSSFGFSPDFISHNHVAVPLAGHIILFRGFVLTAPTQRSGSLIVGPKVEFTEGKEYSYESRPLLFMIGVLCVNPL